MNKRGAYLLGTFILVAVALGVSVVQLTIAGSTKASQGITITEFSYPWAPSLTQAVDEADVIVEGVVKDAKSPRWNTVDGRRPNVSLKQIVQDPFARIMTPYVFSVGEVLKGQMERQEITFVQEGGRVGDDVVVVARPERALTLGERDILFLKTRLAEDRSHWAPNAWSIIDKYALIGEHACGTNGCVSTQKLRNAILGR